LANIGNSWLKKWTWSSSRLIEALFKLAPFLLEGKITKININKGWNNPVLCPRSHPESKSVQPDLI
jgi:hypothetical protein